MVTVGSIGVVYYIHKMQMDERARVRQGVLKELEKARKLNEQEAAQAGSVAQQ